MMNSQRVLREPFNIKTHKKTFINYLEVIILEDGTVIYAVPSHQMALIHLAAKQNNCTERDVYDMCPKEYYGDVTGWLSKITKAIPVWGGFHIGLANEAQTATLLELKRQHLFCGQIKTDEGEVL